MAFIMMVNLIQRLGILSRSTGGNQSQLGAFVQVGRLMVGSWSSGRGEVALRALARVVHGSQV